MTKKERELMEMMEMFKKLDQKEQGFIFGLTQGITICKSDSIHSCYENYMDPIYKTS